MYIKSYDKIQIFPRIQNPRITENRDLLALSKEENKKKFPMKFLESRSRQSHIILFVR